MKQQFTRKLILLAAMLLTSLSMSAYDFMVDDIAYNVIDANEKTAEVTFPGNDWFNGSHYTLSDVIIPPTVTYGSKTFTITRIGEHAFYSSNTSTISLPSTITSIDFEAFCRCPISNIDLPNSLVSLGNRAFTYSSLTEIRLPDNITTVPEDCFKNCQNLSAIEMPGVTSIKNNAFNGCTSLKSLVIPDKVSTISNNAYEGCSALSLLTIGSGVLSIGDEAFKGCAGLQAVASKSSVAPNIGNDVFPITVKWNATLFVPDASIANYSSWGFDHVKGLSDFKTYTVSCNNGNVLVDGNHVSFPLTVLSGTTLTLSYDTSFTAWPIKFTKCEINGVSVAGTFTPYSDYTLTVTNDVQINVQAIVVNMYSVNVQYYDSNMGTVSVGGVDLGPWSSTTLAEGSVTLVVTPKSGYDISSVIIRNESTGAEDNVTSSVIAGSGSYTFYHDHQIAIIVTFAPSFNLTVTHNTGGTVTVGGVSVTSSTIKKITGAMVEVKLIPDLGYELASVLYNGTDVSTTWVQHLSDGTSVIYPASDQGTNQTLDVTFTIVNPTISANYDTMMGSVSIAGNQLMPGVPESFTIGSNVTFSITPFLGYQIKEVKLNGPATTDITATVIANGNSYTITSINDNYTIDVTFEQIPTPASVTATIGTLGMATLYSPHALDFSGVAGLKAYIVSAFTPATNRAILTPVKDVPAKTAVVLVGAAANYTIPTTTTKTYVANLLKGVDYDATMNSSDGTFTNYILADGSNGVGFYVIADGTTLAAGKAYLALPNDALAPAPNFVLMNLEGMDVTGIKNIEKGTADMAGKVVYNLNGQRQNGLKKGFNIVDGKKIVVK